MYVKLIVCELGLILQNLYQLDYEIFVQAANAGGVAVSGLEMSQNAMRLQWSSEEVDNKLKVAPGPTAAIAKHLFHCHKYSPCLFHRGPSSGMHLHLSPLTSL